MTAVAARVQKRSLDPLGLVYRQLWASSLHVSAGNQAPLSEKYFNINFNYWDISKTLASMTLMSIFTSWKKVLYYSTKEIQTKTLFSGKLQNAWSDSSSQLILECTDIINLFSPFLHFRFLLSLFHYSPVCYNPPAPTSPVPWLQVWVTTQHYNSDLQIEKPGLLRWHRG